MDATQTSEIPAGVVLAETQTLITHIRQKLHSKESYQTKALILASCFYFPYAEE